MKNHHSCPKGGSTEVIRLHSTAGISATYWDDILPGPGISRVPVTRHVCLQCGFVEYWVDDSADLEKLRQKYQNS